MKVKETIERECCNPRKDLKPYKGATNADSRCSNPQFCIHCGQLWVDDRVMDAAGSMDTVLKKVVL